MTTTTRTTADNITDEQIEALETHAAEAGDLLQVAICRVALATGLDDIADVDEQRAGLEKLGIIPEHVGADVIARRECARAIAAAKAMEDAPHRCHGCGDECSDGAWRGGEWYCRGCDEAPAED